MDRNTLLVRKAAVLGAGVMGAQIAAHLANANVEVTLFDLPAKEGNDPNALVSKSIAGLLKLEPSPVAVKGRVSFISAANYQDGIEKIRECDLVIEAISERLDWKADLYKRVVPVLAPHAIFATNTSGLSINKLAEAMPAEVRPRFCGVHFFNPPRYMALVELIPCSATNPALLDSLEAFLTTNLGKSIVRAKDTPNFIANRIGVFSMLCTMHHAEKQGLGFDVVDALTGPSIGRPKSATFRTADVVGLDTFSHVVQTMADTLKEDPWHKYFTLPAWGRTLISQGALGQKSGAGVYKKVGKEIHVLEPSSMSYRPSKQEAAPEVEAILKQKNPAEKFAALKQSTHPQAQFLWGMFRDLFHYCAVHLGSIAENARDFDFALRWGYGWTFGPFETWQAAGWQQVAKWVSEDIAAGKAMTTTPLPAWALEAGRTGVHTPEGSYSPAAQGTKGRSALPVYKRQIFPETVVGEQKAKGTTLFENDGVRLWHTGDDIGILSFKSKMHVVGDEVLEGTLEAIRHAEKNCAALVVWQTEPPFSAGANLMQVVTALQAGQVSKLEGTVKKFQEATMALKHALVPTVAAVQGLALGGGCEFAMHATHTVAHLETYMGLVEGGVGLIPAGGGCKELALRAFREAKGGNVLYFLQNYFQTVAMATVSKSAEHARELGYLRPSDTIVFHASELLHIAKASARGLAESGYRPPLKSREVIVGGRGGVGTMKMILANMKEGQFISEHDVEVATRLAIALCGGEVETNATVSEDWLLELERKGFMELLQTRKTQERIEFMLKNGKPLRN